MNGGKKRGEAISKEIEKSLNSIGKVTTKPTKGLRGRDRIAVTKHNAVARRKAKIMDKIETYIDIIPDEAPKHGDIARYMRLSSEIDGTLKQKEGDKHLHIHKEGIQELDEAALRKRLNELEQTKVIDVEQAEK